MEHTSWAGWGAAIPVGAGATTRMGTGTDMAS